jgi:hypothetical protein
MLYVELLESQTRPEGFVVKTLGQAPENRIPQLIEILPHRDVLLQAIGGDGEPGRRGGDGQPGRDGIPGTGTTRAQDATVSCITALWMGREDLLTLQNGTDGGNGGK